MVVVWLPAGMGGHIRGLRLFAWCAIGLAVSSCAKDADDIIPTYSSGVDYRPFTCAQLATERARLDQYLARASEQQQRAQAQDAAGVFWLGVPISHKTGDNVTDEIGRLKGEIDAVKTVSAEKGCGKT